MYPFEADENDDEIAKEKEKAKVLQCLKDVGLFSLLERINGLQTQFGQEWHNALSPGEMQRLSFARIFYHKPKLASMFSHLFFAGRLAVIPCSGLLN